MNKKYALIWTGIFLAGCSSYYPMPVARPTKADYDNYADSSANAIPIPKTLTESTKFSWTHVSVYQEAKASIRKKIFEHSDTSLFGALFAMLGGAAKSPQAVVAGGVVSAGAEIAPGRYQLSVQAANYEKAEKVATCIFDELRNIGRDDEIALATYETIIGAGDDRTVGGLIYRSFKILQSRLDSAQSYIVLASPDLAKLQNALQMKGQTFQASGATTDAAKKEAARADVLALRGYSLADVNKADIVAKTEAGDKRYQQLANTVETCLEQFSVGN